MTQPTDFVILTHGLSKSFGDLKALQSIDLSVPRNSIFGFLGPNGAGKTTFERQSGLAEWLLTKPVTRRAYVLAKLLANEAFICLFLIVIPSATVYGLFYLRAGEAYPLLPFFSGVGLLALNTLFYITLSILLGTLFNSRLPILGIALGSLLGGGIIGSFVKPALYITPWMLNKVASLVVSGTLVPDEMLWSPIIATALWCLVFVTLALAKFDYVEF